MTTFRVSKVTALANVKFRAAKVTLSGTSAAPTFRVAHVTASGPMPLTLVPIADQTVEALAWVTLTAVPGSTSPTPDGFHWRQISGPTVAFSDGGNTITFTAPPSMTSTPAVFGVTAFLGAQSSPEVVATVNLIPHLNWAATGTGWAAQTRAFT